MKEMVRVIIRDSVSHDSFYLTLTDEQNRLLNWLKNNDLLDDYVSLEVYEDYEFEQI